MGRRSRRRRAREREGATRRFLDAATAYRNLRALDLEDATEAERLLLEAAGEATPGPYCIFGDDGHAVSVMPAGRPGDVCKVDGCVNPDGDARWFALATPQNVVRALKAARLRQGPRPTGETEAPHD